MFTRFIGVIKMKVPEGPFALSYLLAAILFAQSAFGTFTDTTLISSLYDVPFSITAGDGEVDIDPFNSNINPMFYTANGAPVQSVGYRF